jgi:hypothetical protein
VDAFTEQYSNLTPYNYGANNPIKYIDINGDSIKVSTDALQAIFQALKKNTEVHFQVDNGYINPESFKDQADKSDDVVLKDLYTIASDKRTVEMSVADKETYKDSQGKTHNLDFEKTYDFDIKELGSVEQQRMKEFGVPDGKTVQGNLGVTLFPGNDSKSGKRSLNNNIQVIINGRGTLNHRAIGVAHEFGHVVLYLKGLPHAHREKGVDKAVYNERADVVKRRLGYDY